MLTRCIQQAMKRARYRLLEDGSYFGEIPGLAGVWANHSEQKWNLLDPGDVDAALRTAAAIGDDTLQRKAQGYVVPDSFTHGTSAQRQRWFNAGFKGGTVQSCDTFGASQL